MKSWYCVVNGQRYGPADEPTLRGWIAEGRVGFQDPVWSEGMVNWATAGAVLPDAFAARPCPPPPPPAGAAYAYGPAALVGALAPGGTGGQRPNADLTAQAREALRGRWGHAIGFCVLFWLVGLGINIIPYVGGMASLILGGPLQLGFAVFFLTFSRGQNGEMGMMFHGFRSFGAALGAYLLIALIVLGWMLAGLALGLIVLLAAAAAGSEEVAILGAVLLVPGGVVGMVLAVLASLSYSQTFYLLADNRRLGPLEAMQNSKQLMAGRRGKLFGLWLRFVGWSLLIASPLYLGGVMVAVTAVAGGVEDFVAVIVVWAVVALAVLIVGNLFLAPYMATAYARFYDDVLPSTGTV